MQSTSKLVTALLLLAIIPVLLRSQNVSSQSLTTTRETFTQMVASTVNTVTLSSTQTIHLSFNDASWYTSTFSIDGTDNQYCGVYGHMKFYATKSQRIFGALSSSLPINFYLMTEAAYQNWVASKSCPVHKPLVASADSKSYALDWTAPQDGSYEFMFLNENVAQVSVTFVPQTTQIKTESYTIYSLSSQTLISSQTFTVSLVTFDQTSLIIITPVLVAIIAIEMWRTMRQPHGQPKRRRSSSRISCPKCGSINPRDNNFCGNCAAAISDATRVYE